MPDLAKLELWFVVGSQALYGEATLAKVQEHAREMATRFAQSPQIPVKVCLAPLMTSSNSIAQLCLEANANSQCIGLLV